MDGGLGVGPPRPNEPKGSCVSSLHVPRISAFGQDGESNVSAFWDGCSETDWAQAHPGVQSLKAQGLLSKTIPLYFHQDGVETYRGVESNMWTWASALTRGDTNDTKILLGFVWEWAMPSKLVRYQVNEEVCKYIDFCVKALEQGKGPTLGFYNEVHPPGSSAEALADQELCGGYRAVYAGWKGDLKARKNEHNFSRAWDSTFMCTDCAACQPFKEGPECLYYTHVGPEAQWRRTTIDHECYMATDGSSPWRFVRGWHLKTVFRDIAHIMWLGVCRDLTGSLLYVLANKVRRFLNGLGAHGAGEDQFD
jgi:hypothetical protein